MSVKVKANGPNLVERSGLPPRDGRDSPSMRGHPPGMPYLHVPFNMTQTYTPAPGQPSFAQRDAPMYPDSSQPMVNPYHSYVPPIAPQYVRRNEGTNGGHSNDRQAGSSIPAGHVNPYLPPAAAPADHAAPSAAPDTAPDEGSSSQKRRRSKAQPSAENEVEAGMALAGMGLGLTGADVSPKRRKGSAEDAEGKDESTSPVKSRGGKKAKQVKEDDEAKATSVAKKSCAECRRMKAKCDRVFPCSNYQDLSCMQGKRLVLSSTAELHDRIAELEAALGRAQRQLVGASPHPLLSAEHRDSLDANSQSPLGQGSSSDLERSRDGRPSPGQRSSSRASFVLQTPVMTGERSQSRMAVESLLIDEGNVGAEGRKEDDWVGVNAAPALIVGNTSAPPDSSDRQIILHRLKDIVRILPDRETTKRQADRFWTQSTWYQNILRRDEFENIYEPSVYAPTPSNPLTPHKLACVLMLLTLDTYLDVASSHDNPLVGQYWDGAQRCFDTHFGWGASVAGVQALGLASLFVGFGWRGAGASNFYWLRMMTSAAQQLGLHKDPHPSLSPSEQTFRRRVFHEMYTLDCLMSINHGQRTAIPHESIEVQYPDDNMPLCKLKYMYMGHVKSQVIEIGCAPASCSKEDLEARVQRLSQMLDRYSVDRQPEVHCPILTGAPLPSLAPNRSTVDVANLTRSTTSMCHFKSLMFLHRPSLRRLIERLRRPGASRTSLSEAERNCVQQTFVASTAVIAVSGFIARHEPRLAARLWSTWVQTFSAAVSLAALAIWCGPYMEEGFIRRAYDEMRGGCDMIREHGCYRAQGVLSLLPILTGLVENSYPILIGSDRLPNPAVQQGEDMLFVLLGGQVDFRPQQANGLSQPGTAPSTSQLTYSQGPARHGGNGLPPRPSSNPMWNTQMSFGPSDPLPTHWPQPPSMPNQGLQLNYNPGLHAQANMAYSPNQMPAMMGQDQLWSQGIDQAEIWARLQTFYEPSLAMPIWSDGMGPGMGSVNQGGNVGMWGFDGGQYLAQA